MKIVIKNVEMDFFACFHVLMYFFWVLLVKFLFFKYLF